jgi:hypothetical protein
MSGRCDGCKLHKHKQLLLCHGRLHRATRPWYIHKNYRIDFERAIHLDCNASCIPDVLADLTQDSALDAIPPIHDNSFDMILPIYSVYHIYGKSWQDEPNNVLIDIASKTLCPGGRIVMALARGFFECDANKDDIDIETIVKNIQNMQNIQHSTKTHIDTSVVIDAYLRTRRTRNERARLRALFLERFQDPDAAASIAYLDEHIPVNTKREYCQSRDSKISVFTAAVEKASTGKLRRVSGSGLVYTDSLNCSVVVFEKVV